jgi:hypothetical protein
MDKMSFADPLRADQFVLDRLVQRRERETGDSRHLGRRIGIVWRLSTHQPLFYPKAGRVLADAGPFVAQLAFTKWIGEHADWIELAIYTPNCPLRPSTLSRSDDLEWLDRLEEDDLTLRAEREPIKHK